MAHPLYAHSFVKITNMTPQNSSLIFGRLSSKLSTLLAGDLRIKTHARLSAKCPQHTTPVLYTQKLLYAGCTYIRWVHCRKIPKTTNDYLFPSNTCWNNDSKTHSGSTLIVGCSPRRFNGPSRKTRARSCVCVSCDDKQICRIFASIYVLFEIYTLHLSGLFPVLIYTPRSYGYRRLLTVRTPQRSLSLSPGKHFRRHKIKNYSRPEKTPGIKRNTKTTAG